MKFWDSIKDISTNRSATKDSNANRGGKIVVRTWILIGNIVTIQTMNLIKEKSIRKENF